MRAALVAVAVLGCAGPEDVLPVRNLAEIAEDYCRAHPELPCGHVWDCTNSDGTVEFCIGDYLGPEVIEQYGWACVKAADARFDGYPLCWYQCPTARGCNSKGGCFCPE